MSFLNRQFFLQEIKLDSILYQLKMLFIALRREYEEDGLNLRAMSLVYISLLSLAPLLAVSFSILKGFGVHNQVESLLLEFLAPLGDKAPELTANIILFVENIQVGVLGFVGFLMLFYTAVSLLAQIEDCFNHIWRVTKPRSLYRRFTDYLSLILIGPVLLFSALGIMASMGNSAFVQRLIMLEPFGTVYYVIGLILPYLLIIALFSFAYTFIPNAKVRLKPALIGGVCAGLVWKITGSLFAQFLANSAQYSAIYSGFAVILLSMIWFYISWLILLLGSVVSFHVQYPSYLHYAKRRPHLSSQCQEKLAIQLMALIAQQHIKGGAAWTLKALSDAANLPWEAISEILVRLKQSDLLLMLEDDAGYVLAHDTDKILLTDILQAIRSAGDQPDISLPQIADNSAVTRLLNQMQGHTTEFLLNRSLRDMV
jgi:membrane protein